MSFEPLHVVSRNICIIVALLIFNISYTVCLTIYVKHKVIIKIINAQEQLDAEVTYLPRPLPYVTATCCPGRTREELLEDE